MVIYTQEFENRYNWYVNIPDEVTFDGTVGYNSRLVQYSEKGLTAKECLFFYETMNSIQPTREPVKLIKLLKAKEGVKQWMEIYVKDIKNNVLSTKDFEAKMQELNAPDWFKLSIELKVSYGG